MTVAASIAAGAAAVRLDKLLSLLLIAMPLIALVPKCLLIAHTFNDAHTQVFDAGFGGFGEYARNLFTDGSFRACKAAPYLRCAGPPSCDYATRMPGLPLLYAGLAKVVGIKAVSVAYAKCLLTALLAATFLFILVRDASPTLLGVALSYGLYFGPQALKHGASLDYEEGVLVDLQLCLGVAVICLSRSELASTGQRRVRLALATVVLAVTLYMVKTVALITLVVVWALVLSVKLPRLTKLAASACVLVPMLWWAVHNYAAAGAAHLSSSWNGENLYRGANSQSAALYPQISLDRLFDSRQARLADGTVIPLGNLSQQRCFVNEWAWNDFYAAQARSWLEQHPLQAVRFQLRKLWVGLFEVRHTPFSTSAQGGTSEYPAVLSAAMLIWMVFARLVFLALIALLVRDLRRGHIAQPLWTLALVAAGWLPYLLVFSYQRHAVPLLVMDGMLLVALYLVGPRRISVGEPILT